MYYSILVRSCHNKHSCVQKVDYEVNLLETSIQTTTIDQYV